MFPGGISGYFRLALGIGAALAVAYHFYQVGRLERQIGERDKTIAIQETKIGALESDVVELKSSNDSLEQAMRVKIEENARIRAEIKYIADLKDSAAQRVAQLEANLRDQKNRDKIARIQAGGKTDLLLRFENKHVACSLANYGRLNGRCVMGKWVSEGERLVPSKKEANDAEQASQAKDTPDN